LAANILDFSFLFTFYFFFYTPNSYQQQSLEVNDMFPPLYNETYDPSDEDDDDDDDDYI
jgi:hypothetical protein